jgi:hypothetical protein
LSWRATLLAAGQVVAVEFQTIAAANNYWRDGSGRAVGMVA